MSLTETGLHMTWTDLTFTPDGGSAIPIGNVTNVNFGKGGSLKQFFKNGAAYATHQKLVMKNRTAKITGANVKALMTIPETQGTLAGKLNDASNGISTGCFIFSLTGCLMQALDHNGPTNEYATTNTSFNAVSPDGNTDPLSWSSQT